MGTILAAAEADHQSVISTDSDNASTCGYSIPDASDARRMMCVRLSQGVARDKRVIVNNNLALHQKAEEVCQLKTQALN